VQDADQEQHESAPNNYEYLLTILSDGGSIDRDAWSAFEEWVPPAEDENAAKHKDDQGESQSNAHRRNSSLCNHRYRQEIVWVHVNRLPAVFSGFYDASGGFSDPAEGGIGTPSSEIGAGDHRSLRKRDAVSTEAPRTNSFTKIKEARVKPEVTIEYCTD
jgi:hypothetical protein